VTSSLLAVALVLRQGVRRSIRAFVALMSALSVPAVILRDDWSERLAEAKLSGGLVLALIVTMTFVRVATIRSPSIMRCGAYLVRQPPGRRYATLSLGAPMFFR